MADAKIVLTGVDKTRQAFTSAKANLAALSAQADSVNASFSALGRVLGPAFAGITLTAFFRSTVNGLDKLNDLADATGDTVENLSALEDVALRTGTSMDTASDAVVKLNKALEDARKDKDSAAGQAIKNLGLDIEALQKLSPVERLQEVGKAMNSFAGDNKLIYNITLLGRGLRETAPLLKDLGEAGKLVGTATKAQADEAERLKKEWAVLEKNAIDLARTLGGPLISGLNDVIGRFREGTKEGNSFWASLLGGRKLAAIAAGKSISDITSSAVLLDSKAGAGRGFVNPDLVKPTLPAIAAGSGGDKNAAKRAAEERRRLAEFSARQIVEIEEQAAQDTADAWKVWESQQIDLSRMRADAEKEQWRQVFDFIDQQQDEAIEQGQAVLDTVKKATDEWSVFADEAARNIQDALGDTLLATMEGNFRNIGDGWKRTVDRMVAEALAAKLGSALLGDFGKSGNVGGLAGDALKWLGTLIPSAQGNAFGPGGVLAFAAGGVVDRATPFTFGGGHLGVMGEAGPEGILPLRRGANGRLGVESSGGGVVVNQVNHFSVQGSALDRRSMAQLQAEVGIATQRAIARNT